MALNDFEQLLKLTENSKHILLLFGTKDNGDAIAAALSLKKFFEKQRKQADVACSDFVPLKQLSFLTEQSDIKNTLANLQKFIIKVDVSKNPLESLSYDVKNSTLNIYLTPKQGLITKNELRTAQTPAPQQPVEPLPLPPAESGAPGDGGADE